MAESFLLVRFSAIGDCVMSAYIATAIRNAQPGARLVWAVESRCSPVIDNLRMVSELVEFPRDRWRKRRWSPANWQAQLALFAKLRKDKCNAGIDLQGHSKTAICLRIANPKRRLSVFATDALAKRLNPLVSGDPDGKHRVERMMDGLCTFGEFQLPEFPLMPTPIPATDLGLSSTVRLATISTGAGALNKQYPTEQWREVALGLAGRGFHVRFLGASVDPMIEMPETQSFVGKFDLRQTMSAVAHSTIHIAADTGTGHMAGAFGVPFVSVFGPTDPDLFRPYSSKGVVLRQSNRPSDVRPERIISAVEELVG